ncbi:MAG: 23S rRNA (guanosine(2251)-2'-O)-methyltransferase RlmB [Pseudomonadota bacterium]|jgi:23S rRNA (guanosine2251-2'-O)-methyltransferase
MSANKVLFGFHAVGVRLKTAPASVIEVVYDPTRRDARMKAFLERAREAHVRLIEADALRIAKLAGSHGHQGVAARVLAVPSARSLDELLERLEAAAGPSSPTPPSAASAPGVSDPAAPPGAAPEGRSAHAQPLLLVLDGVTDPHNLGACLRVADGAGVHAVIAPKDHAAGINATVAKVASGAADTVPYFMVTNLARTLGELKERHIWVVGASDQASKTLYQTDLRGPLALVLGAEGHGLRQLTSKSCDALVRIPMHGAVESLNVSVASAICLYEALRQRAPPH